ncbi:MAG: DUF1836 domain-containing protein [Maledivibacter sp.]|jgi:hypothetical protein|nr:DUF1836 domain-containing protein [Maledivibacter sp.]
MKKCENLLSHSKIEIKDIPNIDLYMDQLTGYIDAAFEKLKIYEDEKILTKTMINNYVKAKVIDKPVKKKYNKNQIMELIMIYHLKNILSIAEVGELFRIQKEQWAKGINQYEDGTIEMGTNPTEEIYKIFLEVQDEVLKEAEINFEENMNPNKNTNKDDIMRYILKLVLKADINKRLAELSLKEL